MNIDDVIEKYDSKIVNLYGRILEIERANLGNRIANNIQHQIKAEIEKEG